MGRCERSVRSSRSEGLVGKGGWQRVLVWHLEVVLLDDNCRWLDYMQCIGEEDSQREAR